MRGDPGIWRTPTFSKCFLLSCRVTPRQVGLDLVAGKCERKSIYGSFFRCKKKKKEKKKKGRREKEKENQIRKLAQIIARNSLLD